LVGAIVEKKITFKNYFCGFEKKNLFLLNKHSKYDVDV